MKAGRHHLGPAGSKPLDVLRMLIGMRERMVEFGVVNTPNVMRCGEGEERGLAAATRIAWDARTNRRRFTRTLTLPGETVFRAAITRREQAPGPAHSGRALSMKLSELHPPGSEAASIHVARLPREDAAGIGNQPSEADASVAAAPHLARPVGGEAPSLPPPVLVFVTAERRPRPVDSRAVLLLIVAVTMAAFLWVLIASVGGSSRASRRAPPHLTPTGQRAATAARVRAAAIAQAKRDRGTDAQWQDTIPAALAPPRDAAAAAKPAAAGAAAP